MPLPLPQSRSAPEAYKASGSSPPRKSVAAGRSSLLFAGVAQSTATQGEKYLSKKFSEPLKKEDVTLKNIVGPTAISQALTDIVGVWMPKLVVLRSFFQFFEETFLEFVEDLAFYFSTALAGFGLHKPMARLAGLKPGKTSAEQAKQSEQIGLGMPGKTEHASTPLIAAKAGTLLGALALGGGFEFMIQHAKNMVTATQFHARNFTAVAGLEGAKDQAVSGEEDPVDKAKRRAGQVAVAVGLGLATAFLAPLAITRSPLLEKMARKTLSYIDFSSGKAFDLSKPILATLAGIGAWSYIDASRDSLERKENATRLAVVIPYMIFGKELIGFALAKFYEKFGKVTVDNKEFKIGELKKQLNFSFLRDENPLKRALKAETFLNMQVQRSLEEFNTHFDEVTQKIRQNNPHMNLFLDKLKVALASHAGAAGSSAFYLSAALTGILINLIAYAMTRERFKHQQAAQAANNTAPSNPATSGTSDATNGSENKNAPQGGVYLPAQPVPIYPMPNAFATSAVRVTNPASPFVLQNALNNWFVPRYNIVN